MKDSADLPRFEHLTLDEDTADLEAAATRLVQRAARNGDDARFLLDVLGLLPAAATPEVNP